MTASGKGKSPTASDVARLAGVSKSAVSRTFTAGASVSAKTRLRVQQAAQRLQYRPNPIARSLTTRRSAIVGVAMAHMDQLYAELLPRLSQRLTEEGFRLLLFKAEPGKIADRELETILQYNVDALILVSVHLSDDFAERCRRAAIPVVQINPVVAPHRLSSVTGANREGAHEIGDFLVAGGHRSFAFMGGTDGSFTSEARRAGFVEALAKHGFPPPVYDVGDYTFEGGLLAARRLLTGRVMPDAIFCANDSMACATIDVARREFGVGVGSALSIVGFDDEVIAGWPVFDATTYSLPMAPLVNCTIDLMRRIWDDITVTATIAVPGEIIVRGSARRPPGHATTR